MEIRLSDSDRVRYGCPEWLPFRLDRLTAREAAVIQHETGLTPGELPGALRYRVETRGPDGVWEEFPVRSGEDPPEGARLVADYDAWTCVVWIALRRAGCSVSFDEAADFDIFGFETRLDVEEDTERGKDESSSILQTTSGD